MIKTKKTTMVVEETQSIICDICKKEIDDVMEIQEFLCIRQIGGYNSIFGDMSEINLDVCQYCLDDILGKYIMERRNNKGEDDGSI